MSGNKTRNSIEGQMVNEVAKLRRDLSEMKTKPQPIGNGSLNYATFATSVLGSFTIPAGLTANISILFMDHTMSFTYDGEPAINRTTLLEPLFSIYVDTDGNPDFITPYGAALTSGQRNARVSWWCDYAGSGLSSSNGQRYIIIQLTNNDSSSHNYWVHLTALIPRPALQPQ